MSLFRAGMEKIYEAILEALEAIIEKIILCAHRNIALMGKWR